jgi:hypothetical protein
MARHAFNVPIVDLDHDERRLLEVAAAHGGRYIFRGLPLREMVATADVAFVLQRRKLVTADVIYCNGYPDMIPVCLTHAGIQQLEESAPELVVWMHQAQAAADESAVDQLVRHQQRIVELERQLRLEVEQRELLALEKTAVEAQVYELKQQLQTRPGFIRDSGVLWRQAASATPPDACCPTCGLLMIAVAAENRLACPECDFTAPFRPRQLPMFRPRPA